MTIPTQIDTQSDGQKAKRPYAKPVLVEINFNTTEGKSFFDPDESLFGVVGPS